MSLSSLSPLYTLFLLYIWQNTPCTLSLYIYIYITSHTPSHTHMYVYMYNIRIHMLMLQSMLWLLKPKYISLWNILKHNDKIWCKGLAYRTYSKTKHGLRSWFTSCYKGRGMHRFELGSKWREFMGLCWEVWHLGCGVWGVRSWPSVAEFCGDMGIWVILVSDSFLVGVSFSLWCCCFFDLVYRFTGALPLLLLKFSFIYQKKRIR